MRSSQGIPNIDFGTSCFYLPQTPYGRMRLQMGTVIQQHLLSTEADAKPGIENQDLGSDRSLGSVRKEQYYLPTVSRNTSIISVHCCIICY